MPSASRAGAPAWFAQLWSAAPKSVGSGIGRQAAGHNRARVGKTYPKNLCDTSATLLVVNGPLSGDARCAARPSRGPTRAYLQGIWYIDRLHVQHTPINTLRTRQHPLGRKRDCRDLDSASAIAGAQSCRRDVTRQLLQHAGPTDTAPCHTPPTAVGVNCMYKALCPISQLICGGTGPAWPSPLQQSSLCHSAHAGQHSWRTDRGPSSRCFHEGQVSGACGTSSSVQVRSGMPDAQIQGQIFNWKVRSAGRGRPDTTLLSSDSW